MSERSGKPGPIMGEVHGLRVRIIGADVVMEDTRAPEDGALTPLEAAHLSGMLMDAAVTLDREILTARCGACGHHLPLHGKRPGTGCMECTCAAYEAPP